MGSSVRIAPPPIGWRRLAWLGPGFLWMLSAAGSGELLFTPRIGALYGYALLWALVAAIALKWVINREIGRLAVCTGRPILEELRALPGPRNWALWLILVPQVVVAVATIAGLASAAATGIALLVPGPLWLWTLALIAGTTTFVFLGRYRVVEKVATVLAIGIAVVAVVSAVSVLREPSSLASGLVPRFPPGMEVGEVLPWLGFALSGAAGMMWYSYWLTAREYGAAGAPTAPRDREDIQRLRGWSRQMTLDNTVAVVGTTIVMIAFLVLGTELLRPAGQVPAEDRTAAVIGELLGRVWGPIGYWVMVTTMMITFTSTVLSDQDGFARLFGNGAALLVGREVRERRIRQLFLVVLLAIAPGVFFVVVGEPVRLLKLAGIIEAAQLPVLAGLVLYLNRTRLPRGLRPSVAAVVATSIAGLFFAAFAIGYLASLVW